VKKAVQPNIVAVYNSFVGAGDRGSSADEQPESAASSIVIEACCPVSLYAFRRT
jgi:hypothetical protein